MVLGEAFGSLHRNCSRDPNTIVSTGFYQMVNAGENGAFDNGHILFVLRVTDYVAQMAFDPLNNYMRFRSFLDRTNATIPSWKNVAI